MGQLLCGTKQKPKTKKQKFHGGGTEKEIDDTKKEDDESAHLKTVPQPRHFIFNETPDSGCVFDEQDPWQGISLTPASFTESNKSPHSFSGRNHYEVPEWPSFFSGSLDSPTSGETSPYLINASTMGDDSEWLKLPTDEKCVHKAWKARVAGYEEATKLFKTLDEKSPEFSKFLGILKKLVTDSNAIAQEKALDAVLAFVENAHVAGRTVGEVSSAIVTKCLNASRAKTKEKGFEILMMYIEIEKQEAVQDALMGGLGNKQPKVVAGCVMGLREALRDFGPKTITLKPIVKQLQKLLEDRDKTVREEAKLLTVEIYRWIGGALKPQLANLKPVQITELEAEFENLPNEKPRQTRFLRSQQDLKAKMEEQAAEGDGDGDEEEEEGPGVEVDAFELMTAVDILSKLPKDFYEKIEAKKWQERKEVLDAAKKLTENPKLEAGDYGDLVRAVKKVVSKDTNVMLVTLAAKILADLANGLRKKFHPYAGQCIQTILEKFKEKKPTVVAALREAIDASYASTTLEPISEDLVEALGNKNPQIKAETAAFLARAFTKCTPTTLPKKLLKMFVAPLTKTINESDQGVREASYQALGTAMKVVGEKPIMPFLAEVDSIKQAKIKEYCDKAELVNMKVKKAAPKTEAKAPEPVKKVVRPASAPAAAKKKTTGGPPQKAGGPPRSGKGKAAAKKGAGGDEGPKENILADETVDEKAAVFFPGETLTQLASSNWKERLAAMEKVAEVLKGTPKSDIPTQVCVRTINKKPGLKDTNFQVLKLRLDVIGHLAQNSVFTTTSASFVLQDLVDKVGDIKNGGAAKEALSCIAEATGLEYVSQNVLKFAFDQKNPKNQAEAINWLSEAVKEFGFKVNIKGMIKSLKTALAATNPAVRTAAITFLGTGYMYMGDPLRMFFEDEKSALLAQIDAEIAKVKGEKPPAPTRGLTPKEEGDEDADEEEADADEVNLADLVPRTDISDKITPELLNEMADKNWKIRNEALQKLTAILNEAKFIQCNIGGLPEAIKARLGDSNKNLVKTTLEICQMLATGMGPNCKLHVRIIGPGIITCMGDSKPHLRVAAVATASAWVEQCQLAPFVEAEIFSDCLKMENPNLRAELLGWLAEKLPGCKKLPPELKECIPHIFSCLEDRNAAVRTKAQESLVPFMIHTGYDAFLRATNNLKPASKDAVRALLEKAKPNLPQKTKPVKAAPPPEPTKSASSASLSSKTERSPVQESKNDTKGQRARSVGRGAAGAKRGASEGRKKKTEEIDTSPAIAINTAKEQRLKDEKNLKVLKWNFTTPRGEYVDQLKPQMEANFSKTLVDQLFHADFKNHIKAIDTLKKELEPLKDATIANLDLLLKWTTLRFFDTNTAVHLKCLDYIIAVFELLDEEGYHLQDFEASSFLPYLIIKVGDPKDNIRKSVRSIFKLMCKVYPASKMFSYIIEGLKSKNAKQRTECLEELGNLIEVYGMNVCQPSPAQALKLIAQQIGDRDKGVRSAALNTVVAAYLILGENVYKYIGNLNDKDQSMLEERIKRSAKTRPPPPAATAKKSPERDQRPKTAPAKGQGTITKEKPSSMIQRPNTARARTQISKEFALDVEDPEEINYEMPKLIEVDVAEVLDAPVELPKMRSRARPPSPLSKLLANSSDASSAIDLVISQVASSDILTCVQALTQIDEVLKVEEQAEVMVNHVDQFLVAASLQLRMCYTKHMGDPGTAKDDVIKIYRCIMGALLALFQCKQLAVVATKDVLKDLVFNLLTILLDARLEDLEEGPQVIRSVNVMVVKIVEKSNYTAALSALIRLLQECVDSQASAAKFLELIMKCLWKMTRMLPNIIKDIQIDVILLDLHLFLQQFPAASWKDRTGGDMPFRTVKTILHSLAKLAGNRILSCTGRIESPEDSELVAYLQKLVKDGVAAGKGEQVNGQGDDGKTPRKEGKTPRRLTKTSHEQLAEIFKKIGSKENTREGLNDLYDFKEKYPEADLEPFLRKSSQFFQTYIERGLKNIELERQSGQRKESVPENAPITSSAVEPKSDSKGDFNPAMYRERLKVLRARCGLDNNQDPDAQVPDLQRQDSKEGSNGSTEKLSEENAGLPMMSVGLSQQEDSKPTATATSVADLKKRLERLKQAQH